MEKQCTVCNYAWTEDCDFCPCCDSTNYFILNEDSTDED